MTRHDHNRERGCSDLAGVMIRLRSVQIRISQIDDLLGRLLMSIVGTNIFLINLEATQYLDND
jgi:hypothetical protein